VVGFDEEKVMALVLGDETQLKSGDEVIGKAEPFQVPVGERFVGRIVDALGNACDGRGKVEAAELYEAFRVAPGVMERVRLSDQLYTGTKIIDAIIPIAKGQRELIVGDRMTGKTVLAVDAILNQRGKDVICIHSQLLERAGRLRAEIGGGTMTFLPIVETQQGDVTGHIPSNLISITDGQIYMSASLFTEGFRPAIDFGLSVSRIGNKIQCEAMKELSRKLRLEYVQYKALQRLTNVQSTLSAE